MNERPPLLLTEAQIDGNDLVTAASEVLYARFEGLEPIEATEHTRQLPQHWRAVYTTLELECQVENGGHHQFFWNTDGELNRETLDDLRMISAKPFDFLFEEALEVYATHDYAGENTSSGNSWEAFTEAYREKRMETLDNAFYNAPTPVRAYLNDFILKNRSLYLRHTEPVAGPNSR